MTDILQKLIELELVFIHSSPNITKDDLTDMIDDDFCEVGASGINYDKNDALKILFQRQNEPKNDWQAFDFKCIEIAHDNYLLTYTSNQGTRKAKRSTIWRHIDGIWRVLYHQGTVVNE